MTAVAAASMGPARAAAPRGEPTSAAPIQNALTPPLSSQCAAASPAAEPAVSVSETPLTIPEGELIILRFKPSLWLLASRLWFALLLGVVLASNLLARFGLVPQVSTRLPVVGWTLAHTLSRIGGVVLVMCAGVIAWRLLVWWNAIYVLTDRRIVVQSGVLRQSVIDAPLRRIQHVSLHRDVEQRFLSLGTLLFSTAGPFGEFSWYMISHPNHRLKIVRETIEKYARNGHGV